MKISVALPFSVLLVQSASTAIAAQLRGKQADKSPYRGQVHVVRGPDDQEHRHLFEGGPDVVTSPNEGPIFGTVFNDANQNGVQDSDETGIEGVMVSDGLNVVLTDANGAYELPSPTEEMSMEGFSVFVTKPAGYDVPVNEAMVPQFHYHHKPKGTPMSVHGRPFRFGGLPPTGPLPTQINFPLAETADVQQFKVIVSGDPQTYSNNEIGFMRDSIVKDLAAMDGLKAVILDGDVMGDDLSLYRRLRSVVGLANAPQYYAPGNHDFDFDSPENAHSFDTFKREFGPDHYSFDIGQVHFVIMNDVFYPCTPDQNADGLHPHCENAEYNGRITNMQINWLKNDLANVPEDKIIFLAMHIPIYAFIDMSSSKHSVDNVIELYEALGCVSSSNTTVAVGRQSASPLPPKVFLPENCARQVVSVGAHTHTNDNMLPGESFDGFNTAQGSNSGGPVPFHQIILGAACGNWWGGDLNDAVVPESFQRQGAPKGYWIMEFDGKSMKETFKVTGKPVEKQMHVDILTPEFRDWFEAIANWTNSEPGPEDIPPFSINDLPDTKIVLLGSASNLSANVYAGTREHTVRAFFDGDSMGAGASATPMIRTQPGEGEESLQTLDVGALKRQMSVARYAYVSQTENDRTNGYEQFRGSTFQGTPRAMDAWAWADQSMHVWEVPIPTETLGVGAHTVTVVAIDQYGRNFTEKMPFEIAESRPNPFFQKEFWPVNP